MVSDWKRQAMEGMAAVFSGKTAAQEGVRAGEAEVEKLHAKIGQLLVERDFCESIRSMSLAKRRELIEPSHPDLSVVRQCQLVSISRSGFFYRPVGETAESLALMRIIDTQLLETPWYGSRQMARHLQREGHAVGRKRVRRLMATMGLAPIYQRPRTTIPNPEHHAPPHSSKCNQSRGSLSRQEEDFEGGNSADYDRNSGFECGNTSADGSREPVGCSGTSAQGCRTARTHNLTA